MSDQTAGHLLHWLVVQTEFSLSLGYGMAMELALDLNLKSETSNSSLSLRLRQDYKNQKLSARKMIYFPIQRQPLQQRDIAASIKANKNCRIAFIRSFLFSFSSRLQYLVCLPLNKILKKDDLLFEAAIENHGPSSPSLSLSSSPSSSYFPVRGYHFKMLLCSVSCCSIKGAIVVDSWKRPREKKQKTGPETGGGGQTKT